MAEIAGDEHVAGASVPDVGQRRRGVAGVLQGVVQLIIRHQHRIQHGDVDVLAEAGALPQQQRGERGHQAVQGGVGVCYGHLDVRRRPAFPRLALH